MRPMRTVRTGIVPLVPAPSTSTGTREECWQLVDVRIVRGLIFCKATTNFKRKAQNLWKWWTQLTTSTVLGALFDRIIVILFL